MHQPRLTIVAALAALALWAAPRIGADADGRQSRDTPPILQAAATYVREFEARFATVVCEEIYDQVVLSPPWTQKRRTRAEAFFAWLDDARQWLFVRNVLEVDGREVPGGGRIIDSIMAAPQRQAFDRFALLAQQNSRFNIGRVRRDFNDPVVALLFLDPDYQARFRFKVQERFVRDGLAGFVVAFEELATPTVIGLNGNDMKSRGRLWIADDGAVVETRLEVAHGSIAVKYDREPRLDVRVPVSMTERFSIPLEQTITGTAKYAKHRRFETSGRIIRK